MIDGNAKTTSFTYDAIGQVLGATFADGSSVGYSLDADGNVLSMADSTGTTTYTYDNLNELTSETLPTGPYLPDGHSVDYTYDPLGNLLTKQDSGGTITYRYDATDEVTGVTDRGNQSYTISYDVDGNQTSILFPNNVTQSNTFNAVGQLSQTTATTSTQQTLISFSYNYTNPTTAQPTSLPYSVTDAQGNTTSYSYDSTSQMTQAIKKTSGGSTLASYSYGYDPAGNLTSKTVNGTSTSFNFNAANELTSATGGLNMTYTYDGNGDRTGSSDGTSISLNAAGQITSITPPGGGLGHGGGTPINYTYTNIGEQERVGAGSTSYQSDKTGLNVQTNSAGNHTYFTNLPDGTLLSETIPSGLANAGTYYYLTDGAGNTVAVVDSTGTVRNTYSYDPLGAVTVSGSQQVASPFSYQGGMFDSQTGYYYTGSGYYDPATGSSFGCHDKGPIDPGEDLCGEDENPKCGGVCSRFHNSGGRNESHTGFAQQQQGFLTAEFRGRPVNRPNRYRKDWGSPRLCNDLHCTRDERIIIGQYEDRAFDPRLCNTIPTSTGIACGLGQLTTGNRIKYLGLDYNTTDPLLQLYAMRLYIRERYGTEDAALYHEEIYKWY